jgi:hypothetical protein
MKRVVMFCFGGRRENLELQLPFIHRILEQNPNVVYHLWNLARTREDYDYIQTLNSRRIRVIDQGYSPNPWERFDDVYRHYAADKKYKDVLFVKLDDDVVFIETHRFGEFISAVEAFDGKITSAKVINNGACTMADQRLREAVRRHRIPLLDVHKSVAYAVDTHGLFLEDWPYFTDEPIRPIPTEDWLSINFIGYDWEMARTIAKLLKTPAPRVIAGRHFRPPRALLGDEGLVNTLPRIILQGMTVAHLTFGPQEKKAAPDLFPDLRRHYEKLGKEYLNAFV